MANHTYLIHTHTFNKNKEHEYGKPTLLWDRE